MASSSSQVDSGPQPVVLSASAQKTGLQGKGLTQWQEVATLDEVKKLKWEDPKPTAQGGFVSTTRNEAYGDEKTGEVKAILEYNKDGELMFDSEGKGGIPSVSVETWTPPGSKKECARIARRVVEEYEDGTCRVIDGYIYTNIEVPPQNKELFEQQIRTILWYEQQQVRALLGKTSVQGGSTCTGIDKKIFDIALKKSTFTFSVEAVKGEKIAELGKSHDVTLLDLREEPTSPKDATAFAVRLIGNDEIFGKKEGPASIQEMNINVDYGLFNKQEKFKKDVEGLVKEGKIPQEVLNNVDSGDHKKALEEEIDKGQRELLRLDRQKKVVDDAAKAVSDESTQAFDNMKKIDGDLAKATVEAENAQKAVDDCQKEVKSLSDQMEAKKKSATEQRTAATAASGKKELNAAALEAEAKKKEEELDELKEQLLAKQAEKVKKVQDQQAEKEKAAPVFKLRKAAEELTSSYELVRKSIGAARLLVASGIAVDEEKIKLLGELEAKETGLREGLEDVNKKLTGLQLSPIKPSDIKSP